MAEQGKKVEVRFGAFTCSIEGYDNPVEQMREILGMMQRMITETPALAETDPDFDASQIESAISDDDDATANRPSPGVVVIRNAERDQKDAHEEAPAATEIEEPIEAAEEPSVPEQSGAAAETPDVWEEVHAAEQTTDDEPDESTHSGVFPTTSSVDSFGEEPMGEAIDEEASPSDPQAEFADAAVTDEADLDTGQADEALTNETPDAAEGANALADQAPARGDDDPFSFLSRTNETAGSTPDWLHDDPAEPDTHTREAVATSEPAFGENVKPVAEPDDQTSERLSWYAEKPATSDTSSSPDWMARARGSETTAADQMDEAELQDTVEQQPQSDEANATEESTVANIFAAPKRIAAAAGSAFNLFASPISNTEVEARGREQEFTHEPVTVAAQPHAQGAVESRRSEAHPATEPAQAETTTSIEAETSDEPREYESIEAPQPIRAGAPIMNVRSIFAAPEDAGQKTQEEPPQVAPAPQEAPAERPAKGRFRSLLSRLHGDPIVGAPAEEADERGADAASLSTIQPEDLALRSDARSVPDQLSAAAAWLTLVQGKSRLTRREVMEVLEKIPAEEPRALADRIKGFGKLVRSGSLILVDDGVFAMAQPERDRFQALIDQQ